MLSGEQLDAVYLWTRRMVRIWAMFLSERAKHRNSTFYVEMKREAFPLSIVRYEELYFIYKAIDIGHNPSHFRDDRVFMSGFDKLSGKVGGQVRLAAVRTFDNAANVFHSNPDMRGKSMTQRMRETIGRVLKKVEKANPKRKFRTLTYDTHGGNCLAGVGLSRCQQKHEFMCLPIVFPSDLEDWQSATLRKIE